MYIHLGDIPTVANNGDILRQYGDIDLAQLHGKRLKSLTAYKIVEPGRATTDAEIELSMAGQMFFLEDSRLHALTDVDLFDEYSPLGWDGDLGIDNAISVLRIYYACSQASTWGVRVFAVVE